MTSAPTDPALIREMLEAADRQLVEALNARATAAQALANVRQSTGEHIPAPRDADVIARAQELANPFPTQSIDPVFREVLSACAGLVRPVQVAYFGAAGSFPHLAGRRRFGHAATLRPYESVREVLDSVVHEEAAFGVVPLETSTEGAVTATLHGLVASAAKLCAELTVCVQYRLFSKSGDPEQVTKIYGAASAIGACERFFRSRFPAALVVDVASGEVAANFALNDDEAAAVGPELLGDLHQLKVLQDHIEDSPNVEMRFGIVGRELPSRTGQDRTVIAFAPGDEPGALHRALEPFATRKINLSRLESRPAVGSDWKHVFFVEIDGHVTDRSLLTAVEELRRIARHVKILGSYPRPT